VSFTQTIIVNDEVAPVLSGTPASEVNVTCYAEVPAVADVTALDNCGGSIEVSFDETQSANGSSCNNTIVRTWSATDNCGNDVSFTQTIIVNDEVAPVLSGTPASEVNITCYAEVPAVADVTALDNCGGSIEVSFDETQSANGSSCNNTIVRTWSATDNCGNDVSFTQTIIVNDEVAPVLSGTPASEVNVTCYAEVPAAADVTALDNCGGSIEVSFDETQSANGSSCNNTIVRTWSATDNCGNDVSFTQTIVVNDEVAPVLSGIPSVSAVSVNSIAAIPTVPSVNAIDNCDGAIIVDFEDSEESNDCGLVVTRTWSAIDNCGNDVSYTQIITVVDENAPVLIGVPADDTVACDAIPAVPTVTAEDNFTENLLVTFSADTTLLECGQLIVRTWSVTDLCGNTISDSQILTVIDTQEPVLVGLPTSNLVEVTCYNQVPTAPTVTATDICDGDVTVVLEETESSFGSSCNNTIVRTWSATDNCGNDVSFTQTIIVNDEVAPVLSGTPASEVNVTCYAEVPAVADVTALDNCGGSIEVSYNETQSANGSSCNNTIIRTWSATDNCGNDVSFTQTIIVNDEVAPVLSGTPASEVNVTCYAEVPAVADVTALDNCGGSIEVSYNETQSASGSSCNNTIVRTWSAMDNCGNDVSFTQTIIVNDEVAPVLSGTPASEVNVTCYAEVPAVADVTALDNCGGSIEVSFDETQSASGSSCNNTIVRTWSAMDNCGNDVSFTQTIIVNDEVAPVLSGTPASEVNVTCYAEVPAVADVTALDNCGGSIEVSFDETQSASGSSCNNTIVRTWSATDNCGNDVSFTQTIIVNDTDAPLLFGVPTSIEAECGALPEPANVTAIDACEGEVTVQFSEEGTQEGCSYNLVRTWTATDACGNTATATQTIQVGDATAPEIETAPADEINVECNLPIPALTVSFSDNCDENLTIATGMDSTLLECGYDVVRFVSATDDCGNTTVFEQTVRVRDTTAPTIVWAADDVTIGCNDIVPTAVAPQFEDNCDENLSIVAQEQTVELPCGQQIQRTWTATDACGNSNVAIQNIFVTDTLAPVIGSYTIYVGVECDEVDSYIGITATDDCGTVNITYTDALNSGGCLGTLVRTYTATDLCGNTATAQQFISIYDTQGPIIQNPADTTVSCNSAPESMPSITIFDACGLPIELLDASQEIIAIDECSYQIVWHWSAMDYCENVSEATTVITVTDTEVPTFSEVAPEETFSCEDVYTAPAAPLVDDNCDENIALVPLVTIINGNCEQSYDLVYTWTATDNCGNIAVATTIHHIVDETAPVFASTDSEFYFECTEVVTLVQPVATDNCGEVSYSHTDGETWVEGCTEGFVRTWTATDECGNTSNFFQNIYIQDTTAPAISGTIEVNVPCDNYLQNFVEATDACNTLELTYNDVAVSGTCAGRIIRTYTATDACGNASQFVQILNLQDTIAPAPVNPISDLAVECGTPYAPYTAIFTDNCSDEVDVAYSFNTESNANDCVEVITESWTATDQCGNTTTIGRTITITDTTDPYFTEVPADSTFSCAVIFPTPAIPMAFDNCDDNVNVEVTEEVVPGDCANTYDVKYIWRAFDNCGNSAMAITTYHIVDEIAPTWNLTTAITSLTFECDETPVPSMPTAVDYCNTIDYFVADTVYTTTDCGTFGAYIFTAIDACGNVSEPFIQDYVVIDTTAPVVDPYEANIEMPCDSVSYEALITATDVCNNVTITFEDTFVSNDCQGQIIRNYTIADDCQNVSYAQQTITLVDQVDPMAALLPENQTIECGTNVPTFTPQWFDNCDNNLELSATSSTALEGCNQVIYRSWTATDNCGNSTTLFQTITLEDTTEPQFMNLPPDYTTACSAELVFDLPTALDACDGNVQVNVVEETIEGSCEGSYVIERTFTSTDNCGNTATATQLITVVDTIAPQFTFVPADTMVNCIDFTGFALATATDSCSSAVITFSDSTSVFFQDSSTYTLCGTLYTRTWTATDACGNASTATTNIIVIDDQAPSFNETVSNVSVSCEAEIPAYITLTASDACGTATVIRSEEIISSDDCGNQVIEVSYTAVDACGNANYTSYTITVSDLTEPTLTGCPADIVLSCNETLPAPAMVTALDNCDENITVVFEEFILGDAPAEGSIADCDILTPALPEGNPCGYATPWAMAMFGLPNAHKYYTVHNGNFVQYPNGSVHVTAEMRNTQVPANGWNVNVWFDNQKSWTEWSTQSFPTSFKADCGASDANFEDWYYYLLQAAPGAEMTGFGGYTGSSINLVHAPTNNYFGFQLGDGANNYNNVDNGFGGWFNYTGYMQLNGAPFGNNNGAISGGGDFAFELDCCPKYTVVRQWTATDCSGNMESCAQQITFESAPSSGQTEQEEGVVLHKEKDPSIDMAPNPATDRVMITFFANVTDKATIELYDVAGNHVQNVYNDKVGAGTVHTTAINVAQLPNGVYIVKYTNGTTATMQKLIVAK
jgi:large repetitive protein